MLLFTLFFLMASAALAYALSYGVYAESARFLLLQDSQQSFISADAAAEDAAYRFVAGIAPGSSEVTKIGNVPATTTVTYDNVNQAYDIAATANDRSAYRHSAITLYTGSGASFNFGVQSGNGGFELTNGSSVIGNVFSNGTIVKTGGGSATIYGDAISAGASGLIDTVHATGSAWAHTVKNSTVDKNVYAYTLNGGVTNGGAEYYTKINGAVVNGSPDQGGMVLADQATSSMPITDTNINDIEQDIITNGTVIASTSPQCAGGTYTVTSNLTLGFVRIQCNFIFKKSGGSTTLTLTGPIWVEGNFSLKSGPSVVAAASTGNKTIPIVADNKSNNLTSGEIVVENGTTFTGNGGNQSYILLISQNKDAENGGTNNTTAISLAQSAGGTLLTYAAHGKITLANSIALNEVTGYKISLGNSAQITYKSGLVNLLFTSGPGGGYTIGSWKETQ